MFLRNPLIDRIVREKNLQQDSQATFTAICKTKHAIIIKSLHITQSVSYLKENGIQKAMQAYSVLLYLTGVEYFKIESKTLHQKKVAIHFIVRLDLLRWSGTKPAVSLRYVCRKIMNEDSF